MKVDAPAVMDTSAWIGAAWTPRGDPAAVVRRVLRSGAPVFTGTTLAGFETRLGRSKLDRCVRMELRRQWVIDLRAVGHWVRIPAASSSQRFCRGTVDAAFFCAALAASAHWLISGDDDPSALHPPPAGLHILSPRAALASPAFTASFSHT